MYGLCRTVAEASGSVCAADALSMLPSHIHAIHGIIYDLINRPRLGKWITASGKIVRRPYLKLRMERGEKGRAEKTPPSHTTFSMIA